MHYYFTNLLDTNFTNKTKILIFLHYYLPLVLTMNTEGSVSVSDESYRY